MQISGSPLLSTSPLSVEPLWDKASQVVSVVPKSSSSLSVIERPVMDVDQAEAMAQRQSRTAPVRMVPDDYARRALATYESVSSLERRDGLQMLMGVDDYA